MKEKKQTKRNLTRRDFVKATAVGLGATALTSVGAASSDAAQGGAMVPKHWDREADVVVIGAGATGLPAAIEAIENGASVIVVEANNDVGGAASLSGGNAVLGGGTSRQQKYGIKDSPDLVFSDLTDWSIIEPNGYPDYRYNDREVIRAYADNCAPTCEWLMAHGIVFTDRAPDNIVAYASGNSAPRENHCAPMNYAQLETGVPVPSGGVSQLFGPEAGAGIGFTRPMEAAARKAGAQILLEHRMATIVRESPTTGRVLGIIATNNGKTVTIRAKKGVVIGTGGHSGNPNFRRIFDPRLTEEYRINGAPWVISDGSGELAAMALGASLWGAFNQTAEFGVILGGGGRIGTEFGGNWKPGSPVFPRVRAMGLACRDHQNIILVNKAGRRFYNEMHMGGFPQGNVSGVVKPYTPGSYLNIASVKCTPENYQFINAALAGTGDGMNGGGMIWAIFDADAVKREEWKVDGPPDVDRAAGYFFSANSIPELARSIVNKYQVPPMPPDMLQDTVTKYNSFVDAGKDPDFDKPAPKYKIQTPPFYAGSCMPSTHDTRSGLRINAKCEVVDLWGNVIPGLYCGGESAGGFSMHGLGRCSTQGRIAGREAAKAKV